jgi:hypothetical protein
MKEIQSVMHDLAKEENHSLHRQLVDLSVDPQSNHENAFIYKTLTEYEITIQDICGSDFIRGVCDERKSYGFGGGDLVKYGLNLEKFTAAMMSFTRKAQSHPRPYGILRCNDCQEATSRECPFEECLFITESRCANCVLLDRTPCHFLFKERPQPASGGQASQPKVKLELKEDRTPSAYVGLDTSSAIVVESADSSDGSLFEDLWPRPKRPRTSTTHSHTGVSFILVFSASSANSKLPKGRRKACA